MSSNTLSSSTVDEESTEAPITTSSTALPTNMDTNATLPTSSSNDNIPTPPPQQRPSWSQRNSYKTPTPPPRWRFVNNAKSTSGYNSTAAGNYIRGLSAEELAANKYSAPNYTEDVVTTKKVVEVNKLGRREGDKENGERGWLEVGKLNIEELSEGVDETIVGEGRRFGRRRLDDDGAEVVVEEEEVVQSEQPIVQVVEAAEMSLEEKNEGISKHQEEQEETATVPILQQLEQIEAEESVTEAAATTADDDDAVEEEEVEPVQDEESPIEETSPMDEKQESSSPLRKRRCIIVLLVLLLIGMTIIIIGIVFGTRSGSTSSEEVDSTKPFPILVSRCPANEKYVSIRHYTQQQLPSDEPTRRRIVTKPTSTDITWSLRESCSGNVLMKCEPCLFSDKGDIAFEFIEKRNRLGDSYPEGEDIRRMLNEDDSSGICVPDDREYVFEVRKTNDTEDRCCNFDATTFFVSYDNVTVVDSAQIDSDSSITSTSFSNEEVGPCPSDSPSLSPSAAAAQPEAQCVAAGEDTNLCLAIDMSGSLCNRGTGYECLGCVDEAFTASICNRDGVDIGTCCGNFYNVKEFAKGLISVFGTIPSEQSYSIVGFATNASFVSELMSLSEDAFSSLDSLIYSGGKTNHAAAIRECQQTFSDPDVAERKNVIMLITDGNPTVPGNYTTAMKDSIDAAIQAKEAGSILIPVMLTTASINDDAADYMTELSTEGLFLNTSLSALDSVEENLLSKVLC